MARYLPLCVNVFLGALSGLLLGIGFLAFCIGHFSLLPPSEPELEKFAPRSELFFTTAINEYRQLTPQQERDMLRVTGLVLMFLGSIPPLVENLMNRISKLPPLPAIPLRYSIPGWLLLETERLESRGWSLRWLTVPCEILWWRNLRWLRGAVAALDLHDFEMSNARLQRCVRPSEEYREQSETSTEATGLQRSET